jgi:hypothetical protein
MVFNLLPVYPLDGGRTLRGALSLRMHANQASYHVSTVGLVGNGIFLVSGILSWLQVWDPLGHGPYGFLLAWLGLEGIQRNRALRMQAKYDDIYADHDPFQKALLASQMAQRGMERAAEKERRRRLGRQKARFEQRAAIQATVDRLLERITEVGGVEGLSGRERRELEKASKRLAELDRAAGPRR